MVQKIIIIIIIQPLQNTVKLNKTINLNRNPYKMLPHSGDSRSNANKTLKKQYQDISLESFQSLSLPSLSSPDQQEHPPHITMREERCHNQPESQGGLMPKPTSKWKWVAAKFKGKKS